MKRPPLVWSSMDFVDQPQWMVQRQQITIGPNRNLGAGPRREKPPGDGA
jgi:hypothetical protein